jgi:Transposase DDE domain
MSKTFRPWKIDEPLFCHRRCRNPQSRIMKSKDGFVQAYNAQAAVDAEAQIIVAQDVTQNAVDCGQLMPMTDAIEANLGRKPAQLSADAGYCGGGVQATPEDHDARLENLAEPDRHATAPEPDTGETGAPPSSGAVGAGGGEPEGEGAAIPSQPKPGPSVSTEPPAFQRLHGRRRVAASSNSTAADRPSHHWPAPDCVCDSLWISEHGLELGRLDRHCSDRYGRDRILPGLQPVRLLLVLCQYPPALSARRWSNIEGECNEELA